MSSEAVKIIKRVAEEHGITSVALLSSRKTPLIVRARHEAFLEVRLSTDLTYEEMASLFRKERYTIIKAVNKLAAKRGLEIPTDRKMQKAKAHPVRTKFGLTYGLENAAKLYGVSRGTIQRMLNQYGDLSPLDPLFESGFATIGKPLKVRKRRYDGRVSYMLGNVMVAYYRKEGEKLCLLFMEDAIGGSFTLAKKHFDCEGEVDLFLRKQLNGGSQ